MNPKLIGLLAAMLTSLAFYGTAFWLGGWNGVAIAGILCATGSALVTCRDLSNNNNNNN